MADSSLFEHFFQVGKVFGFRIGGKRRDFGEGKEEDVFLFKKGEDSFKILIKKEGTFWEGLRKRRNKHLLMKTLF